MPERSPASKVIKMDVRIRPAGYILFAVVIGFLVYRLLYTLLWEHPTVAPSAERAATAVVGTPIVDWLVLAPIPSGVDVSSEKKTTAEERMAKRLDTVYLPDEAHLNPDTGSTVQIQGKTYTWVPVNKKATLDLVSVVQSADPNAKPENAVAYVVATIQAPKPTSDATLLISSDDGVKVWLNGTQVLERPVERNLQDGVDQAPHLKLNRGSNTLVFKVGQSIKNWALTASINIP